LTEGVVVVAAVAFAVLLCYDNILVGRGPLWFAPVVLVSVVYFRRVLQARVSIFLTAFLAWLGLVSLLAGLPSGTFMLLLLCGITAAGAALGTFGLVTFGRGLVVATGTIIVASTVLCQLHWHRAIEVDELYSGAWRGLFDQKNALGFTAAFLIVLCIAQFRTLPRGLTYVLLMSGTYVLLHSRSISALGALLYTVGVYAVLELLRRQRRTMRTRHVIALLALMFVAVMMLMPHVITRFGRDPTLTGRTVIWSALWHDASKDLAFGHGVGAYWFDRDSQSTLDNLEQQLHFRPGQAHNGALEAVLDGGIVELVLLVGLGIAATRRAMTAYNLGVSWPILMLVFAFMTTTAERGFYSAPMLFVAAAIVSAPLPVPAVRD
jgi:O-antigen ligase